MNGHRRRVIALTTAGILLAAGLVGGGWWLGQNEQGRPVASGGTSAPSVEPSGTPATPPAPTTEPVPTTPAPVGTWRRLPTAPIPAGGYEYNGVWTGRELLIVGAASGKGAGMAYNPATNTWRRLPSTPGPAETMEGGYTAVWAGRELLGGGLGLDAAYNPATNRWRRLPAMGDAGRTMHSATWTGRQLLVWGGRTYRDDSWTTPHNGVAYDPATNRWSAMPRSPLQGRTNHVAAWTGSQLLIWGGSTVAGGSAANGAAYVPQPL